MRTEPKIAVAVIVVIPLILALFFCEMLQKPEEEKHFDIQEEERYAQWLSQYLLDEGNKAQYPVIAAHWISEEEKEPKVYWLIEVMDVQDQYNPVLSYAYIIDQNGEILSDINDVRIFLSRMNVSMEEQTEILAKIRIEKKTEWSSPFPYYITDWSFTSYKILSAQVKVTDESKFHVSLDLDIVSQSAEKMPANQD